MAYGYPYGNGQQLNLDWFLEEWKNLLAAWEAEKNGIDGALQAEIDRAEAALADVFAARDAAAQSAANALESKNAAAQSASDASGYLSTVQQNATAAQDAARNAAQSESNAADSAQTALASKNAAGQSERNAAQSEANANSSKNAAAQSASDADASKSAAAQSASDADASKSAAAQSASDAEDAAASVEASAHQITTNANDIANLKESSKPENYTPQNKLLSLYANNDFDGTVANRTVHKTLNRFKTERLGDSGQARNFIISGKNQNLKNFGGVWNDSQITVEDLTENRFLTGYFLISHTSGAYGATTIGIRYYNVDGDSFTYAGGDQVTLPRTAGYLIYNTTIKGTHFLIVVNQGSSGTIDFVFEPIIIMPNTPALGMNNATKDSFYEAVEKQSNEVV